MQLIQLDFIQMISSIYCQSLHGKCHDTYETPVKITFLAFQRLATAQDILEEQKALKASFNSVLIILKLL